MLKLPKAILDNFSAEQLEEFSQKILKDESLSTENRMILHEALRVAAIYQEYALAYREWYGKDPLGALQATRLSFEAQLSVEGPNSSRSDDDPGWRVIIEDGPAARWGLGAGCNWDQEQAEWVLGHLKDTLAAAKLQEQRKREAAEAERDALKLRVEDLERINAALLTPGRNLP